MKDRIPTYPGRVRLIPVDGQTNVFDLERADEPTEPGTPLSKANLLSDATAALYGLGENATVDQVLSIVKPVALGGTGGATAAAGLANLISALSAVTPASGDKFPFLSAAGDTTHNVTFGDIFKSFESLGLQKTAITSYVGTGNYGDINKNTLSFDFKPEFIMIITCNQYLNSFGIAIKNSPGMIVGNNKPAYSVTGFTSCTIDNWYPFTWYANDVDNQLNANNYTYYVFAAGRDNV